MKIKSMILSFFGKSAAACVGLCLLFYIAMEILAGTSLDAPLGIPFGQFMLLLLSAVLLAASSYLLLLPLPKIVTILLNYIACFLSVFLTFAFGGKFTQTSESVPVFMMVFTVSYAIFWGIFLFFRFILYPEKRREKSKKEQKKEAEYVNRF